MHSPVLIITHVYTHKDLQPGLKITELLIRIINYILFCCISCEIKNMYCRPRNVTIAHTEPNKMLHSMLKIHEEHPTFKINAHFGLKNGNLNLIKPKCNRKIMT